jgi:hypothetical protein
MMSPIWIIVSEQISRLQRLEGTVPDRWSLHYFVMLSLMAFLLAHYEQVNAPSVRYVGRGAQRVRSSGTGEAHLVFPVEIAGQEGANRVEYRWRRSGQPDSDWFHGGDFPPGRREVHVSGLDFPSDAKQGERIVVEFRTFNGESYSTELTSAEIAVNTPPSITLATTYEWPVRPEAGKPLVLPFSVSDEDGDAVTLLYRIGDDVSWSTAQTASGEAVLPVDVVSRLLSTPDIPKVEVAAFDGLEVSPFAPGDFANAPALNLSACSRLIPVQAQVCGPYQFGEAEVNFHHVQHSSRYYIRFSQGSIFKIRYAIGPNPYSGYALERFQVHCVMFGLPSQVIRGLNIDNHFDVRFMLESLAGRADASAEALCGFDGPVWNDA